MVNWIKNLFSGRTRKVEKICDTILKGTTGFNQFHQMIIPLGVGELGFITAVDDSMSVKTLMSSGPYVVAYEVHVDGELVFRGGMVKPFYNYEAEVFEEGQWVDKLINLM